MKKIKTSILITGGTGFIGSALVKELLEENYHITLLSRQSTKIKTPTINASLNATAPYPVSNSEFTKTLANTLKRPSFFTVPAFALKLLFGKEMSRELLIEGQKVLPSKLLKHGYVFKYERVEESLNKLLKENK